MFKSWFILLILLPLGLLSSCKPDQKTYYSIRDYRAELRPMLYSIVNTGILTYDTGLHYIRNNTTDQELLRLSHCEHPLIRARALAIMLERPGLDQQKIINEHLDDSAVFTLDWGEFGFVYQQVSDYVLDQAEWADSAAKAKTIQLVLTRYNRLVSAYTILNSLKQDPRYYAIIREMAERTYNQAGVDFGKAGFPEYRHILMACYSLASYNKPADRPLIKRVLKEHMWRWTDDAFYIMKKYPDEDYQDLLEQYYKWHFYRNICEENNELSNAKIFIETIAVYKNNRSAILLADILKRSSFINCKSSILDTERLTGYVYSAVHEQPSSAYEKLKPDAEKYVNKIKENTISILMPSATDPDRSIRKLRW